MRFWERKTHFLSQGVHSACLIQSFVKNRRGRKLNLLLSPTCHPVARLNQVLLVFHLCLVAFQKIYANYEMSNKKSRGQPRNSCWRQLLITRTAVAKPLLPRSYPSPLSSFVIMHIILHAGKQMPQQLFDSSLWVSNSTIKQLSSGWAGKITPARSNCTQGALGRAQVQLTFWSELSSCEFRVLNDWKLEWIWMHSECRFSFII